MQARRDCELFLFQEKMPKSGVRNFSAGTSRRLVLCREKRLLKFKGISSPGMARCWPAVFAPIAVLAVLASPRGWVYLPPATVLGRHFPLELLIPRGFAAPWSKLLLRTDLAASAALGRLLLEILAPAELCRGWCKGLFCLGSCPQHRAGSCTGDT